MIFFIFALIIHRTDRMLVEPRYIKLSRAFTLLIQSTARYNRVCRPSCSVCYFCPIATKLHIAQHIS
jgi:hypothetical protein